MKKLSAFFFGLLLRLGRQACKMGDSLLATPYARGGFFSLLLLGAVPIATAAWTTPPPGTATTGQNISLAFYYYPSWATTASIWAQAPGSSTWTQIGGGGGGGNGGSLSGSGSITVTAAGTWYFKATEGSTPNGAVVAGESGTTVSAANHPPTFGLSYPSYLLTNQSFTMGIGASDVDGDLHSMGIRWQGMGLVGGPWMISGSSASATTGTLTAPSSAGSINVRGEVWDNAGNGVTGSWESIPVYAGTSFSFGTVTYNGSLQTVPVTASPSGATYTLSGNYQQTNAGTYSATATANGSYRGSYTGNWTIARADQTISFGSLSSKTYGDPPFGVSASASSGLAVSFSVVGGPASISGSTVTLTGSGTVTIRASQGGNSNYNAATAVDRSFVVSAPLPPAPVITSGTSASGTVGVGFSYQITASNSPTGYSASALPAGLSINTSTGAITGTPTAAGTTNLTIGATNSGGTGTASLTITVLAPPSITSQPVGGNVNAGVTFTFSVTATGSAPFSYQWKKNGTSISGATSSSYQTPPAQLSDAGSYTVVVSNAVGSATSSAAVLTVSAAPSITAQPQNQTITAGGNASFSVTATGSGTLTYQWQRKPSGGSSFSNLSNGGSYSGTTSSTLGVSAATAGMSGDQFQVVVTNPTGSATSSAATLTVNTPVPAAPVASAASSITSTGFTASWSAVAGATGYRLDVLLGANYVAGYQDRDVGNATSLAVTGLTGGTSYTYRVRAANASGTSPNSNVVTVTTPLAPPTALPATAVTGTSFVANWSVVPGATGYRLDVSTSSSFATYLSGYQDRDVGTVASFAVTGLTVNTVYYYRVRAVNATGVSANSNVLNVTAANGIPLSIQQQLGIEGHTTAPDTNNQATELKVHKPQ